MNDIKESIEKELQELRRHRDELAVRLNLGKKDLKDLFLSLENRWLDIEEKVKLAGSSSGHVLDELRAKISSTASELKEQYEKLKAQLPASGHPSSPEPKDSKSR